MSLRCKVGLHRVHVMEDEPYIVCQRCDRPYYDVLHGHGLTSTVNMAWVVVLALAFLLALEVYWNLTGTVHGLDLAIVGTCFFVNVASLGREITRERKWKAEHGGQ